MKIPFYQNFATSSGSNWGLLGHGFDIRRWFLRGERDALAQDHYAICPLAVE
jgi:hypothetical protein